MERTVITFLPIDEMRIIKQIILVNDSKYDRDVRLGYILYERQFTSTYKFEETPQEERNFGYYLEYPRQNAYPSDKVDDLILQAIRNTFPMSILRNHLIVSNIDQQRLQQMQKRPVEMNTLQIIPDFAGTDIYTLAGKHFRTESKEFSIFLESRPEDLKDLWFYGYYNTNDNKVLEALAKVNFK